MSRTETRARLFSWLGELLWYLAGSDELSFVRYYIENYKPDYPGAKRVRAAYGPRIRSEKKHQLRWIVQLIRENSDTRRAVIPIYHPKDTYTNLPEVPCTCTLQFLLRGSRLELVTHMRSNDAYKGLPGDIFAFTMIQEIVARALGVELGRYKHLVGSLHLYVEDRRNAERYLAEGWQRKITMPIMPLGDPFPQIERLVRFERATRLGTHAKIPSDLPEYWQDLARLLAIFRAEKEQKPAAEIRKMRERIHSDAYAPYIEMRRRKAEKFEPVATQSDELPFDEEAHA